MYRLLLTLFFMAVLPAEASALPRAVLFLEHGPDAPYTQLLASAFEKGGKQYGFSTEIIVEKAGPQQTAVFRKAAADADLIIVATDNFHEILRDNAANFRRVKFGSIDAGIRAPNIMSVTFADEQAAFLAGAAAAMLVNGLSVPEKGVGWLSGQDTPAMRSLFNGFYEGVRLDNAKIKVIQAVVGSFTYPAQAAIKAKWLHDSGASIIALAAGAGNPDARQELGTSAWYINLDQAQKDDRPVGAIVKALDRAVLEIMESAASPKFRGKEIVVYDLANKGVDFILSVPAQFKRAAAEVNRRVAELRNEIIKGNVRLRSLRQRTLCDCLD